MHNVKAGKISILTVAGCCLATALVLGQEHPAQPHHHAEGQKLKNPVPSTAESVARGSELFAMTCAMCHGETGKGDGRFAPEGSHSANFTDDVWQHGDSDGEIFYTIRNGIGPDFLMDTWQGAISDENIWSLVNYLKTLSAKK